MKRWTGNAQVGRVRHWMLVPAILGLCVGLTARGEMFLVDLGRNNGTDGSAVSNPDASGRYWNNLDSATQNTEANRSRTNLVSTANQSSTIGITLAGDWQSNGRLNGGLFDTNGPQAWYLGEVAVEAATEDYYYLTGFGQTGSVTIAGLDPDKMYRVGFFGSRNFAGETRETTYSIGAASVALITSGNNIGSDAAYDGNDDKVAKLTGISPDAGGVIVVEVEVTQGGFGYINTMTIEAYDPAVHQEFLVDFSRGDGTNGHTTSSPDSNGNYWNNLSSTANDAVNYPASMALSGLVTKDNEATGVGIQMAGGWYANGLLNGGLFLPNGPQASLLGDFAIETATEDYYYLSWVFPTGSVTVTGLDPDQDYTVLFFGSRNTATTRQTVYSSGGQSYVLTTSGAGIGSNGSYNGNDNTVAGLYALSPDASGTLVINVDVATPLVPGDSFGYINVMKIRTVPSTADNAVYIDCGVSSKKHALDTPDSNGRLWEQVNGEGTIITGPRNAAGNAMDYAIEFSGFTGVNSWNASVDADPALAGGAFAFEDVTDDGIYFDDNLTPSIILSSLDDARRYTLTLYGARVSSTDRTTTYTVGSTSATLQTSGSALTDEWNGDTVAVLAGLAPSSGSITVDLSATGGFGYLNAMKIESSVAMTLSNTVAMLNTNASPLSGDASSGNLVQLIAVGPNGVIDTTASGLPEGDDYLVNALNNPTYIGAGQAIADTGLILQNMIYGEDLAGTRVFIRYWNTDTPSETSLYGDSPTFILPGPNVAGTPTVDFLPTGSSTPEVSFTIPTLSEWGLICLAAVLFFLVGRKLLRRPATGDLLQP